MDYNELFVALNLDKVEVHANIIKPVRNGDVYKRGRVEGFKAGIWTHRNPVPMKENKPYQFTLPKAKCIKKPKVYVVYNAFNWGKREHADWIDVDNCDFEIVDVKK